jgi:hypothetical protein
VTAHGIRHTFHVARQQGVPDAGVKAMAGRSGTHVAARGQDKHLHCSRGVTVEEMRQASMALMQLIPTEPSEPQKVGTLVGADEVGTENRMTNDLQRPRGTRRAGSSCPVSGRTSTR